MECFFGRTKMDWSSSRLNLISSMLRNWISESAIHHLPVLPSSASRHLEVHRTELHGNIGQHSSRPPSLILKYKHRQVRPSVLQWVSYASSVRECRKMRIPRVVFARSKSCDSSVLAMRDTHRTSLFNSNNNSFLLLLLLIILLSIHINILFIDIHLFSVGT